MAFIVQCPQCQKKLKLKDEAAGKQVRCPSCKHPFVTPASEEEEAVVATLVEEEAPPSRQPPEPDEEDEEEDRPRRRKRPPRDIPAPMLPMIYGGLSCVFCCVMPVGFALGALAMSKANSAIDELPNSRRADAAYQNLRIAKLLGIIGMCLSGVMLVIALVLNVLSPIRH